MPTNVRNGQPSWFSRGFSSGLKVSRGLRSKRSAHKRKGLGTRQLVSGKELEHSCLETNAGNVNCFAIVHAPCMQLPRCRACTWVIFDLQPVKFYGCASTRRSRVSYATAVPESNPAFSPSSGPRTMWGHALYVRT